MKIYDPPQPLPKSERVTVTFPGELLAELDSVAERDAVSRSEAMRAGARLLIAMRGDPDDADD